LAHISSPGRYFGFISVDFSELIGLNARDEFILGVLSDRSGGGGGGGICIQR